MIEIPKIIIVEDHPIMREGLANYFNETGRWQVMGTASTLSEAKELVNRVYADIFLLDIQLEDGWGLDIIPYIANQERFAEQTRPIMAVYSSFDDYAHVSAALGMGVKAYICKRRNEQELEAALRDTLDGKPYIDETAQSKLNKTVNFFSLLTKREAEIFRQVTQGLSNKQIAENLKISPRTVENILSCVYDKTGIRSRAELERL
jgi:DNA-binding NarL/FixJ family response regulator